MSREELAQVDKALEHASEHIAGMAAKREMLDARRIVKGWIADASAFETSREVEA